MTTRRLQLSDTREAGWFVDAIARDEGSAFLLSKRRAHLLSQPLVNVDGAVIKQALCGRRHRIEFHGRIGKLCQHGVLVSGRAAVSPIQPVAAPLVANGTL